MPDDGAADGGPPSERTSGRTSGLRDIPFSSTCWPLSDIVRGEDAAGGGPLSDGTLRRTLGLRDVPFLSVCRPPRIVAFGEDAAGDGPLSDGTLRRALGRRDIPVPSVCRSLRVLAFGEDAAGGDPLSVGVMGTASGLRSDLFRARTTFSDCPRRPLLVGIGVLFPLAPTAACSRANAGFSVMGRLRRERLPGLSMIGLVPRLLRLSEPAPFIWDGALTPSSINGWLFSPVTVSDRSSYLG